MVGGDFNSRIGDLNNIKINGMNWRYESNCDKDSNLYGRHILKIFAEQIKFFQ